MTTEQKTELVTTIRPEDQTPVTLLHQALAMGVDTDTLKQFMDLQERYEANEARKAFAKDMALCQKKMPVIVADSPNVQTSSLYAKLGKITSIIAPVYTAQGFSLMFDEIPIDGDLMRIQATVLHRMGHQQIFHYDVPLDLGGLRGNENKTPIQAKGSSTTYARRYLTCMIFNLAVGDDLDGQDPTGSNGRVDEQQAMRLSAAVDEWRLNDGALLREFGIVNWSQLPAKDFDKAMGRFKQIGERKAQ